MFKNVFSMKSLEKTITDYTYTDYYYRLMLIARSVFEWSGLPDGMDEKWIEKYLFNEGNCIFFKDDNMGFMVTKCAYGGKLNAYDEPTFVTPIATNYVGKSLENNIDAVIICNNDMMLPTANTIQLFAYRLAQISRTIDINIHAQKTPVMIKCTEKQRLSLVNVYKKWDGFTPVIFGDKNLDTDDMKTLKTDAPVVFDRLQIQKNAIWNECMTFLGINNANMDKRERLVDDEVQANNQQVAISADVMLKSREKACERINDIFGLNVSVKRRTKHAPILDDMEGGEYDDSGEIYRGSEKFNG